MKATVIDFKHNTFVVAFTPNALEKFFGAKHRIEYWRQSNRYFVIGGKPAYTRSDGKDCDNGSRIQQLLYEYSHRFTFGNNGGELRPEDIFDQEDALLEKIIKAVQALRKSYDETLTGVKSTDGEETNVASGSKEATDGSVWHGATGAKGATGVVLCLMILLLSFTATAQRVYPNYTMFKQPTSYGNFKAKKKSHFKSPRKSAHVRKHYNSRHHRSMVQARQRVHRVKRQNSGTPHRVSAKRTKQSGKPIVQL